MHASGTVGNADTVPPEYRPGVLQDLLADRANLEAHLLALDDVPMLLVYTHLSDDETLLQAYAPHIKGAWAFEVEQVPELKQRLVSALIATLEDYAANQRPLPPAPPADMLQRMCDAAVGGHVPIEYQPMVLEELNFDRSDLKTVRWRRQPSPDYLSRFMTVVIGSFSRVACPLLPSSKMAP